MIYFTSDQHFYHSNVIAYCARPFASVEEMNLAIVANWNAVVRPEDTVYVLGDFSLAIRPVELFSHLLNGTKFFIPGNHDWCHSYNKKARGQGNLQKWIDKYTSHGWTVLPEHSSLSIPGVAVVNMSHLPYAHESVMGAEAVTDVHYPSKSINSSARSDHDKFAAHRIKNDGRWLLCGHVHEKWKTRDRMINVGIDVWDMKPVSIEEIKAIILGHRPISTED